jgi:hypothetical protein
LGIIGAIATINSGPVAIKTMPNMTWQGYFRQKRIQRIEMIRSKTYFSWVRREYTYQRTLIVLKLALHLLILLGLGLIAMPVTRFLPPWLSLFPGLLMGWLSVEIHDYIWLNYYKEIKFVLDKLFLLTAVILVAIAITIYFQGSGEGSLLKAAQDWHQQFNQDLQRKSAQSFKVLGQLQGKNWRFVVDAQSLPELVTANQVRSICESRFGVGWRLPRTNELSALQPYPTLSRQTYAWALNERDGINLNATRLSLDPTQSGKTFVSYSPTDVHPILCVQE